MQRGEAGMVVMGRRCGRSDGCSDGREGEGVDSGGGTRVFGRSMKSLGWAGRQACS